ncbi:hypothetical protein AB0A71_35510 [Kitasatospora aureofaciens]|uniref:hypothetical protein n=1 Tax=Kitasatospora aureofaciens TaxID=1894 RepID=UPI0033E553F3
MSTTRRRALGPGTTRVLADTVRAPRTPPPWSPAAVEGALHAVLQKFERTTEPWREAFEDLDEDVLAETAAEARVFDTDPARAVDELVRGTLGQLADWQAAIGERGRAGPAAARVGRRRRPRRGRPLARGPPGAAGGRCPLPGLPCRVAC